MLGLFDRKEKKEGHLKDLVEKEDWTGLAKACYDLGKGAMEQGELEKATLWLSRADTIYSASDEIYEAAGKPRLFRKEITEDCPDRLAELEEAETLYNTFPAKAEEQAEDLAPEQLLYWNLLSVARLTVLCERLGKLPGCQVLGNVGWAVETVLRALKSPISQEEYQRIQDLCSGLYELGDSPAFYGGGEIEVPNGPAFQVFDLNGMTGVHLMLESFLDGFLRDLASHSQGEEGYVRGEPIAGCGLLPDYYVRTGAGKLEDVPQIQAELERVRDDFAFVSGALSWEELAARVEQYQALDILQK